MLRKSCRLQVKKRVVYQYIHNSYTRPDFLIENDVYHYILTLIKDKNLKQMQFIHHLKYKLIASNLMNWCVCIKFIFFFKSKR